MTDPSKEEERALSRDELELVSAARHPGLRDMSDRDLSDLVRRLRERRDRARDTADRQRREMRGKAGPAGASASSDNAGTRSKEHFLGAALARAMEERERREGEEHAMQDKGNREDQRQGGPQGEQGQAQGEQGQSQHDIAEKALEMRKEADKHKPEHPENTPTPDQGMQPNPDDEPVPSVQQEGHRVVVDRTQRPR